MGTTAECAFEAEQTGLIAANDREADAIAKYFYLCGDMLQR